MKITAKFKRKTVNYLDGAPITIGFIGDSVTHGCFEMYKPIEGEIGRASCRERV